MDDKFDSHMSLQQESFLKPRQQDISKKHGKMRTKFDRLVIAVHLLNTYCGAFQDAKGQAAFDMEGTWGQDVDPAAQVPLSVVEMTYLLCEHFEKIWDYLDFARVGHTLPPEVLESADSQQAIAPPAENSHKQLIAFLKSVCGRCWKDEDLDFFLSFDIPTLLAGLQSTEYQDAGITAAVVKATMEYILTHKDRWFQYASSSAISRALWRLVGNAVKDKGLVMYVACVAAKLLAALGLGAVVRTVKVPGGGNPNWWFVAKKISAHDHGLLNVFGIHDGSTPSLKALTDRNASELVMPTRAPPEVQWGVAQRQTCADVLKYVGIALPGGGLRQSQMQHEWHLLQALPCRSPRLHRHMRRGLARQHRSKPQGRRPPLRMAIQHQRPSLQFQQRTLRATFLMASRPHK